MAAASLYLKEFVLEKNSLLSLARGIIARGIIARGIIARGIIARGHHCTGALLHGGIILDGFFAFVDFDSLLFRYDLLIALWCHLKSLTIRWRDAEERNP